jgi:hypothetical protein
MSVSWSGFFLWKPIEISAPGIGPLIAEAVEKLGTGTDFDVRYWYRELNHQGLLCDQ